MSRHLDDDLIEAFVDGALGEHTAVEVALHLDGCPLCSARAAALEPLAPAFARSPDPVVPPDLVASVLAEAARPEESWQPGREVWVGLGMLAAVGLLATFQGEPVDLAARLAVWMQASSTVARAVQVALPTSVLVGSLAAVGLSTLAVVSAPRLQLGRVR